MKALSIQLSDELIKASQSAARKLKVSRTQFIRQAIIHELQNLQAQFEQEEMAKSFVPAKKHPEYIDELKEIDDALTSHLPKDRKEWWKKKKQRDS